MLKPLIKRILTEIFNPHELEQPGATLPLRFAQKKGKTQLWVFRTKTFKYILEIDEYPHDILSIAFRVKLPTDYEVKMAHLKRPVNAYTYKTNDPQRVPVLNTVMKKMMDLSKENPKLSFIFFGADDLDEFSPKVNSNNTARYRVYKTIVARNFSLAKYDIEVDPSKSAIAIVSKAKAQEDPELETFIKKWLGVHS